jgi:hypothetical protein
MMRPAGLLPTAALLFLTGHAVHALADQRVEAVVQETKVTHCDATKIGGCAGTLTLKRAGGGKGDSLAVRVPAWHADQLRRRARAPACVDGQNRGGNSVGRRPRPRGTRDPDRGSRAMLI